MEEDIKKKSTQDIVKEMSLLDQEIGLLILRYNKLQQEIVSRFPQLKNEEEFQPKVRRK